MIAPADGIYRSDAARWYDRMFGAHTDDIAFYIDEAGRADGPVLEVGCGTGRLLAPLAEAGIRVTGLDRAPDMLARARARLEHLPAEARDRVRLVEGDVRDMALGERYELIIFPARAFLHLLTAIDQRRALGSIRDHLVEGGRLIVAVFDPSIAIIGAHGTPLGGSLKKIDEFQDEETGRRVIVWDTRRYELEEQLIVSDWIFEEVDAGGRVVERTYAPLTLRYVFRYEMQYLLELCGFGVEALYGDFQRGTCRAGGEQVWVARRQEERA